MGFIFLDFPLRLLPVLNCSTVLAASLLLQFIGTLSDLRRQIGRGLGLGFRLRLNLGFWFQLDCGLGFGLRLAFGGIKNPIRQQFHIGEQSQERISSLFLRFGL